MVSRPGWLLALVVAGALVGGCTRAATQLVVVVDSDLPSVGCYGVRVSRIVDGAIEPGATRTFLPGSQVRPFSFGVTPPDGNAANRVEVAVEALASCTDPLPDERVVRRAVRTGFLAQQTLRLAMFLPASCGAGCTATETCPAVGPACEPIPTIEPSSLEPVAAGGELADAAAELVDAGTSPIDAFSPEDASVDAFRVPVDVGPAPACSPISTAAYTSIVDLPPLTVAPREASGGWRAVTGGGGTVAVYDSTGTGTPGTNQLLFDETGLVSVTSAVALGSHRVAGSDDPRIFATVGTELYLWTSQSARALRLATGVLRAGLSVAPLGGSDSLFALTEAGGTLVIRRASDGMALSGITEDREVALAPTPTGGALVALGQGAAPSQCDVVAYDASAARQGQTSIPTAASCDGVGVAALGADSWLVAYRVSGQLFYRRFASGALGEELPLGPAEAGHIGVWPDGAGGARVVWRAATAELRSRAIDASAVAGPTTCITGPASADFGNATSARQATSTFVLVAGGGRSGAGLQYAVLVDP